jgi:hypothetical protein
MDEIVFWLARLRKNDEHRSSFCRFSSHRLLALVVTTKRIPDGSAVMTFHFIVHPERRGIDRASSTALGNWLESRDFIKEKLRSNRCNKHVVTNDGDNGTAPRQLRLMSFKRFLRAARELTISCPRSITISASASSSEKDNWRIQSIKDAFSSQPMARIPSLK